MGKNDHLVLINAFLKYVRDQATKDSIEKFTATEIRKALSECAIEDRNQMWYQEMQKRLSELEQKESKKKDLEERNKEKWKDRFIGAVFTLVVGLILAIIKAVFFGG